MAKYKLGKNAVATLPSGIVTDDFVEATVTLAGDELDVTVFGDTETQVQPGLVDATFELVVTNHSVTVGVPSTITIAGLTAHPVICTGIDAKVSPKGRFEYTLTYATTVES